MEPTIVQKERVTIMGIVTMGIAIRTSNTHEIVPATALIPGMWQRFFTEQIEEQIPQRINPDTHYAIYTNYESDYTGAYTYILGSAVSKQAKIPEGMVRVEIPSATYMIFTAQGAMPTAIVETWNEIWNYFATGTVYQRAYTVDFELYDKNNPEKVDIYIALR